MPLWIDLASLASSHYTPMAVVIDNHLPREPLISSCVPDWPLPPRVYSLSESEMVFRARITDTCRLTWRSIAVLWHVVAFVTWAYNILNDFRPIWSTLTHATVRSELHVSEHLMLEMIFLPIKLRVTAASALQNVRYCFPTWNKFMVAVGYGTYHGDSFPHCAGVYFTHA